MTPEQMTELEIAVNEKVRAGCKMFPTLYDSKDDPQLLEVSQWLLTYFVAGRPLCCQRELSVSLSLSVLTAIFQVDLR